MDSGDLFTCLMVWVDDCLSGIKLLYKLNREGILSVVGFGRPSLSLPHTHAPPRKIDPTQLSGDRDPSKLNITGGIQLLTRDEGTGLYDVKEVGV